MSVNRLSALFAAVLLTLAASFSGAQGTGLASSVNGNEALPDIIVWQDFLGHQWVVRDEDLPHPGTGGSVCSVEEGSVTPGTHPVLRFSVVTPNIGTADLALGDPNQHIANNDGLYEFATCHQHFHFHHFTVYQLIDPATGKIWRAAKRGFCMIDVVPSPAMLTGTTIPVGPSKYRTCGRIGVPGNQGISVGWADEYIFLLSGQYFVLDGGDGQDPVPAGTYKIHIEVNPVYERGNLPGTTTLEPCPVKVGTSPSGKDLCRPFRELNYDNNVAEALVQIADHPGRDGLGPLAGSAVTPQSQPEPIEPDFTKK